MAEKGKTPTISTLTDEVASTLEDACPTQLSDQDDEDQDLKEMDMRMIPIENHQDSHEIEEDEPSPIKEETINQEERRKEQQALVVPRSKECYIFLTFQPNFVLILQELSRELPQIGDIKCQRKHKMHIDVITIKLCSTPTLASSNSHNTFDVECDASKVLVQNLNVIIRVFRNWKATYKAKHESYEWWKTLWRKIGTNLLFSSTCHPQSGGSNLKHGTTKPSLSKVVHGMTPINSFDLLPFPYAKEKSIPTNNLMNQDFNKERKEILFASRGVPTKATHDLEGWDLRTNPFEKGEYDALQDASCFYQSHEENSTNPLIMKDIQIILNSHDWGGMRHVQQDGDQGVDKSSMGCDSNHKRRKQVIFQPGNPVWIQRL